MRQTPGGAKSEYQKGPNQVDKRTGTGTGEFNMQHYLTFNLFQNNIVYAGKHGRLTSSRSGSVDGKTPSVTMDYNLYFFGLVWEICG
jgi:hypothetical protein